VLRLNTRNGLKEERQWLPRKSDVLFRGIGQVSDGGLVDWGFTEGRGRFGPFGRWSIITEGYYRAANAVVEKALAEGGADALVFPAVALYRRYLEMQLKACLSEIHETGLTDQDWKETNGKPSHDLLDLWNKLRAALADFQSGMPSESITAMTRRIREMHYYDPDGQSFGYGEDSREKKRLDRVHSIDLRNLHEEMEWVYGFFVALQEEIEQEQDAQMELDQYRDDLSSQAD
jgi:hypothetical protein